MVLVTRDTLPNITKALLLFTVVIEGIAAGEADAVVYQLDTAVTSNGVTVFTPEKATMAPVVAVELVVTAKV